MIPQESYVVAAEGGGEFRQPNRVYMPMAKFLTPAWFDAENFTRCINAKIHRSNILRMRIYHEMRRQAYLSQSKSFAMGSLLAGWVFTNDKKWGHWAFSAHSPMFIVDKINRRYDIIGKSE